MDLKYVAERFNKTEKVLLCEIKHTLMKGLTKIIKILFYDAKKYFAERFNEGEKYFLWKLNYVVRKFNKGNKYYSTMLTKCC